MKKYLLILALFLALLSPASAFYLANDTGQPIYTTIYASLVVDHYYHDASGTLYAHTTDGSGTYVPVTIPPGGMFYSDSQSLSGTIYWYNAENELTGWEYWTALATYYPY